MTLSVFSWAIEVDSTLSSTKSSMMANCIQNQLVICSLKCCYLLTPETRAYLARVICVVCLALVIEEHRVT